MYKDDGIEKFKIPQAVARFYSLQQLVEIIKRN